MSAELEAIAARLAELEEEQGGEEGAFSGFDRINAASVKERLKEVGADDTAAEELAILKQWLDLATHEAALKKRRSEPRPIETKRISSTLQLRILCLGKNALI